MSHKSGSYLTSFTYIRLRMLGLPWQRVDWSSFSGIFGSFISSPWMVETKSTTHEVYVYELGVDYLFIIYFNILLVINL